MTVTVETLTGRHIEAVRKYAEIGSKKTLLTACRRAADPGMQALGAMRKVADAYNKLNARGFFGPWEQKP